ncbi:hypothetical protein HDV06_005326 [Boothiomyces sp. JEL0866]|nr:hypothetical protein HDV06_005326 [Boothiomyces sp. JEL0866]
MTIFAKQELVISNWSDGGLYFDYSDIAQTKVTWIHYLCPTIFMVFVTPIFISGIFQIIILDALLSGKDNGLSYAGVLIRNPTFSYFHGLIPGILFAMFYWLEMFFRGINRPFSVNGAMILPYNLSYTQIVSYSFNILITLYGLYRSMKSYERIKLNFLQIISSAKEQGIAGHIIFQVLHIGYAMPIVGGVKSFELLIWIYPSVINIYYGTYCMILAFITPILLFLNVGKNVYIRSSEEKAWNPFYKSSMRSIN